MSDPAANAASAAEPCRVLTRAEVPAFARTLEAQLAAGGDIRVDLAGVERIDSAGAAMLSAFARRARAEGRRVELSGASPEVAATLTLFPVPREAAAREAAARGLLVAWGEAGLAVFQTLVGYLSLSADIAAFTLASLLRPRRLLWRAVALEMAEMGSRALGVVGLIAFLVGGTMALQGAAQLRQFGANVFVADLIGISVTRELGPLMTAIVVAGRTGAAVAAELATMQVSEEIDALTTMGLKPVRLLVVPKSLALMLTQPLLTMFANALAIGGALIVAMLYLDVGAVPFLNRLEQALAVRDLMTGLVKSVIFAALIVSIGAAIGLATRGGADEVGRSTTRSVVASIFAVIVADAVCSLVFYFGG